tara:strand:- start:57 stop:1214 length:1158 start_codon:yes stop_codon:yes gene_type:complete
MTSRLVVNSIRHTGSSSDAVTLASDGTCAANLSNRQGKNLVVNGAFQIAQRGTSSTTFGYHTVDRFQTDGGGFDEIPTQAQVDVSSSDTPYTLGLTKAWKITNGNQTSGAGTGDYIRLNHKIEAQNIRNSGWNYKSSSSNITLSFWVKSSVAQTFYLIVKAEDSPIYLYATPYSATTSWTKITKTIPGNSNLVFDNDNQVGLTLFFPLFYGTDYTDNSASDDTWGAYNGSSQTKDQTSTWYTTDDATFEITGVQLEVSDHATDFEHKSFAEDLRLCQRYFYMMVNASDGQKPVLTATCYTDGSLFGQRSFPVTMRANPSVYQVSSTAYYRAYGDNTSRTGDSVSISVPGTTGCELEMSVSGTSVSRPYFIRTNDSNARIGFSAEL